MNVLEIVEVTQFRRDIRKIKRRGKNLDKLKEIVLLLVNRESLPVKYREHNLTGNWCEHRECHIESDWLLIYKIDEKNMTIKLVRTGSHSDLF